MSKNFCVFSPGYSSEHVEPGIHSDVQQATVRQNADAAVLPLSRADTRSRG